MLHKLLTVITTSTVLAFSFTGIAAASTFIEVHGNGVNSNTNVSSTEQHDTTLSQTNISDIQTSIYQSNNTGGNSTSYNTGENSNIQTGNANSKADVKVLAGKNDAMSPDCGCNNGDIGVKVSKNGAFSLNNVNVQSSSSSQTSQLNDLYISTVIGQNNNTGANDNSFNTGGSNQTSTGDASSWASTSIGAGSNSLH